MQYHIDMKRLIDKVVNYLRNKDHIIDVIIVLIILSLPFYGTRFSFFGIPINITEVLTLIVLILSIFSGVIRFPQMKKQKYLLLGAFLMCLGVFIATLFGEHSRAGFGVLKGWFIIPMLFALVVWMRGIRDYSSIKVYLWSYFASSVGISIIVLGYFVSGDVTYDGRLQGFYASPNYLALYLSPAVFFIFYVKELGRRWQSIVIIGIIMMMSVLYLTNSFSAWIAVIGSSIIMIFLMKSKRKYYFFIIVAIGIALIALQINEQKIKDLRALPERSSVASRIMIWESALMIGQDHRIFGITPNTFQEQYLAYQEYFPPYLEWAVPQPHNLFLAFWLQSGVIGLIGFLTVLLWFYRRMYHFIRKNATVAFLVASMTSILLYGLTDTPYWKNDLAFLFWLLIGIGAALSFHLRLQHLDRYQVDTVDHHSD